MSVCEAVNCNRGRWNVHIVAGDIRRQALEVAERGLYPQTALEHVPRQLQAYFARVGEHFLVKPRVGQPGYVCGHESRQPRLHRPV